MLGLRLKVVMMMAMRWVGSGRGGTKWSVMGIWKRHFVTSVMWEISARLEAVHLRIVVEVGLLGGEAGVLRVCLLSNVRPVAVGECAIVVRTVRSRPVAKRSSRMHGNLLRRGILTILMMRKIARLSTNSRYGSPLAGRLVCGYISVSCRWFGRRRGSDDGVMCLVCMIRRRDTLLV